MIVGWAEKTAGGVRIFQSKRGRFFHDPVTARARETVIRRRNRRRSHGASRRETYLIHWRHLDGPSVIVRISWEQTDGAA
jgi:hypothetical protein